MSRVWPALFGALSLAMPDLPVAQNGIEVSVCGQPGVTTIIPFDGPPPVDHGCCDDRACHAGCGRKRPGESDDDNADV